MGYSVVRIGVSETNFVPGTVSRSLSLFEIALKGTRDDMQW